MAPGFGMMVPGFSGMAPGFSGVAPGAVGVFGLPAGGSWGRLCSPGRRARRVPAVLGLFLRLTALPFPAPSPAQSWFGASSSAPAPLQLPALLPTSPRVPTGLRALLTGIRSSPECSRWDIPSAQQPLHCPAGSIHTVPPAELHHSLAWGLTHTSLSHPVHPIPPHPIPPH